MESQYYTQTPQQVLHAMESREEGLTTQQAQERIEKNGPNALREERKKPVWQVFLEQFKDLLVVILIVALCLLGYVKAATRRAPSSSLPCSSLTRCWERYSTVRQKNPWRV